jgi:hypothetical protein
MLHQLCELAEGAMPTFLLQCMSPFMADFVAKVPKYQATIFSKDKEAKLNSPINMPPRPLAKSLVSFSLRDEFPHIFIRESHQRPRRILINGGKRLLQQNRHRAAVVSAQLYAQYERCCGPTVRQLND